MEKLIDYLKQLELSELEAKLYLTLLQTGPISVRELAATTEIKRTTAYLYIDELVEKGLVLKLVKGSRKLIAAEEPKALSNLVDSKLKQAQAAQDNFPDILNSITTSLPLNTDINEAEIKYYKGENGVKHIYEEALKSKELRSYANFLSGVTFNQIGDMFSKAFKENKNLIMYEMLGDTKGSRNQPLFDSKRYFRKYIPNNVKLSTVDTLIYDGKVSIVTLEGRVTGVVLQNSDYYTNSKELFDFIWGLLPENKDE